MTDFVWSIVFAALGGLIVVAHTPEEPASLLWLGYFGLVLACVFLLRWFSAVVW